MLKVHGFFYVKYRRKTPAELNRLRLILVTLQVYSTDLKNLALLKNPLITLGPSLKDTWFLKVSLLGEELDANSIASIMHQTKVPAFLMVL